MAGLEQCIRKMEDHGLPAPVIESFEFFFRKLASGDRGLVREADILPLAGERITGYETLNPDIGGGTEALRRTVVIKLTGGMGTGMGLDRAKSLVPARNGLSFLEITARQILSLSQRLGAAIPLICMNSFYTRADVASVLDRYSRLPASIPNGFLQHKFPRVTAKALEPVSWPANRALEWNPPGHGEVYQAFALSGALDACREQGYRYAFISNIDNLGATPDERIAGYMARTGARFCMEVARRTPADQKGGHLAARPDGGIILRETAQCPAGERRFFEDIRRYGYFNTNNLWVDLDFLAGRIARRNVLKELPCIFNKKRINSRDPASPEVYQIETAMGAWIACIKAPAVIHVPRDRFVPVKRCGDLLVLWSDWYSMDGDYRIRKQGGHKEEPVRVMLDQRFFSRFDQLRERFGYGPPSLIDCTALSVEGDFAFGTNVRFRGEVRLINRGKERVFIPHGEVLHGEHCFP